VKKKKIVTSKDKKDWVDFTKSLEDLYDKDTNFIGEKLVSNKMIKLDLHGFSLDQANKVVKKFITESYEKGLRKILVITGKGLRSTTYKNPYFSEKMNVLKYSVPEYIKNDEELFNKINKITTAEIKDGGEGAFYIFFKKKL